MLTGWQVKPVFKIAVPLYFFLKKK
jgi:hypothetical protein